jgi:hypothetical protein
MATVLAGETPSAPLAARAFAAPPELWQRALALEACAVQLDRVFRGSSLAGAAPLPLRQLLGDATAHAVRQSLVIPLQFAELDGAARECGARLMVLKGAAPLLEGAAPGGRSMGDIDILAAPSDAGRFHQFLRHRLGYRSAERSPEHHLPTLTRPGALPVEVHIRLGPHPTRLDTRIWRDAQRVNGTDLVIPSKTSALLHALEHGALVHWAVRYRLRDLLDIAQAWTADVDRDDVAAYVGDGPQRVALMTLLGGARRFAPAIPIGGPTAWRTVRRVARARHLVAAHVRDGARATSLCVAAGVVAEASLRALLRPAQLAVFGVHEARVDRFLPLRGDSGAA